MINEEKINKEAEQRQAETMSSIYQNYNKNPRGKEKVQLKKRLQEIEEQEKKENQTQEKKEIQDFLYNKKLKEAQRQMKLSNSILRREFSQMSKRNPDGSLIIGIQ